MTEGFMTKLQNRKWVPCETVGKDVTFCHPGIQIQIFIFHSLCTTCFRCNKLLSNDQCCCVEVVLHYWSVTVHVIDLKVDIETQKKATAALTAVGATNGNRKSTIFYWKESYWLSDFDSLGLKWLKTALFCCCLILVWSVYTSGCLLFVPVVLLKPAVSIESKHEVTILSGLNEFVVKFHGPAGSKNLSHCVFWSDSCARYWFGLSCG